MEMSKKSEFIMKSTRKKNPNKTTPIKLHTSYMDPPGPDPAL